MITYKFYDTSALIKSYTNLIKLNPNERIVISSETIAQDRILIDYILKFLYDNRVRYEIYLFHPDMLSRLVYQHDQDVNILATALDYDCTQHPDETIFITGDKEIADIANLYFGEDSIIYVE